MVGRYKVKGELKVLGMKEGGRFSFSDVKEAFRMQLAEQPNPTMAQVVTEAAMVPGGQPWFRRGSRGRR